jgi:hypothetical protein
MNPVPLDEGKSFSTRPERGIIGEISGNNQIRCKQDNWRTFRMAKQMKATSLSKSLGHDGRLPQAVAVSAPSKVAQPVLQISAAVPAFICDLMGLSSGDVRGAMSMILEERQ